MQEDLKKVSPDNSGSIDKILKREIRIALYDIEVMIDRLEEKKKTLKKYSIYKRLFDIHSLLSEK